MKDISRERVCAIASKEWISGGYIPYQSVHENDDCGLFLDNEAKNLLVWLSAQYGTKNETTVKKALAIASYLHDLTENEKCELIAKHPNGAMGKVIL